MKHFRYSVLGLVGVALCLCGCENKSNSGNEQPYEIDYVNANNWLKIPAMEQAANNLLSAVLGEEVKHF